MNGAGGGSHTSSIKSKGPISWPCKLGRANKLWISVCFMVASASQGCCTHKTYVKDIAKFSHIVPGPHSTYSRHIYHLKRVDESHGDGSVKSLLYKCKALNLDKKPGS